MPALLPAAVVHANLALKVERAVGERLLEHVDDARVVHDIPLAERHDFLELVGKQLAARVWLYVLLDLRGKPAGQLLLHTVSTWRKQAFLKDDILKNNVN